MIQWFSKSKPPAAASNGRLVEVRGIHKTYHIGEIEVPAVRGIDLTIDRGELTAIMGPSGSGKSTLMHVLGCLDRCDRGNYLLDGVDVTHLSKRELARVRNEKLGFVFRSFNLLSRTTVLDNVALPLTYCGVGRRERKRRAAEMLERVGLSDRSHHLSNQLSGGQQQRVAIARSLIADPLLLLADEPTGNLDSAAGKVILEIFGRLNEAGQTIVMVTHDSRVAEMAHRCYHLEDGVLADGRS